MANVTFILCHLEVKKLKMKKRRKNKLNLLIHHLCQSEPSMIHPHSSTEEMLRFSRKVNGSAQQQ
jgi:hypothetical protein